jgi:hypothetical protein
MITAHGPQHVFYQYSEASLHQKRVMVAALQMSGYGTSDWVDGYYSQLLWLNNAPTETCKGLFWQLGGGFFLYTGRNEFQCLYKGHNGIGDQEVHKLEFTTVLTEAVA